MSGSTALVLSNRSYPTPAVSSNFARNLFDWETLFSTSTMPPGGSISRAGNAMLYDSTGKLTYAPNNLLTHSSTFNNAAWSVFNASTPTTVSDATAPDGSGTSWTLSATSANGYLFRSYTAVVGQNFCHSIYVKAGTSTTLRMFAEDGPSTNGGSVLFTLTGSGSAAAINYYGTASGWTATITSVGNGWYRISLAGQVLNASWKWQIAVPTSGQAVTLCASAAEAVTYQTTPSTYVATTTSAYYGPRFDVDPVTLQPKGLLAEGARTNLQPYSQSFSSWTTSGGRLNSLTAQTSLDGTSNAVFVPEDSTTGFHQFYYGSYSRGSTSALTYTCTVYAKAAVATQRRLFLAVYNGAQTSGAEVIFDLINGQIGVAASVFGSYIAPNATITPVGNTWYRCSLTFTSDTNGSFFVYLGLDANTGTQAVNRNYAGNGTSGVTVFGVQLEQANFATSYIPTVASSVARAAETFSLTGYANRLVEAYYIDQETGVSSSVPETVVSSGAVTINPPAFGWVTSLRAYTNAYAGSISSPSWLSFSRAGNAMYYDSTGTLTWAPANIFVASKTDASANWAGSSLAMVLTANDAIAPDWTTSATKFAAGSDNGSTVSHNAAQVVTAINSNFISSIYVKPGTLSFFTASVNNGNTNSYVTATFSLSGNGSVTSSGAGSTAGTYLGATISPAANGFYRVSLAGNLSGAVNFNFSLSNSGTPTLDVYGRPTFSSTTDYVWIWGAQLERVTYQTAPSAYIPTTSAAVYGPRYDYDPSTVPATPRGLLIEESRANLLLQSQTFNTSWTLNNILAFGSGSVVDAITAPDGTTTADKIVENTSTASHFVNQTATVTNGASYTYSVFAKAGERKYLAIYCVNTAAALNTFFNLSNGTVVSTSSGATSSITSVGNGWYRCSVTTTTTSTTSGIYPGISPDGVNASYTGDGVSGIFLWGAQVEAGSFATSYIPTTTASVTRAADVAQLTGSALTVGQGSAGTAIVQFSTPTLTGSEYALSYDNSGTSIYANTTAVRSIGAVVNSGGSAQVSLTFSPAISANTVSRAAFAWTANSFAAVANNGTVQTDPSGILPVGINVGYLGLYRSSPLSLNGPIASVALYNTRLPDAILKQKSAINAPY